MNCKCIEEINKKLEERNLELSGLAFVTAPKFDLIPVIATKWLNDKAAPKGAKRRPPPMFASYCPFCGVPINANKTFTGVSSASEETYSERTGSDMSDTPRTDTTDLYDYQTAVDFSRSLERENTELRECLIAMLSNFGGIACAKTHPYDWDRWRKAAFPALSNDTLQGSPEAQRKEIP